MRYIGIDPGVTGAVAHLWDGGIGIVDLPTFVIEGKKKRTVLDQRATLEILLDLACVDGESIFLLEAPVMGPAMKRAKPTAGGSFENEYGPDAAGGQSIVTLANSFRLNGQIEGMIVALSKWYPCRYEIINPQTWKRQVMPGEARDKDAARQKAIQLFPSVAEQLKLKKHHNRAEALLLAEWGRRRG